MKSQWILTTAAAVFVVSSLVSLPGHAGDSRFGDDEQRVMRGHHGEHGNRHFSGHLMRLLKRLDLSTEQRDEVRDVMQRTAPEMQALGRAKRDNRDRLAAVTPDDANYASIVAEVSQSNAALAEKGTLLRAQLHTAVWAILTDAQKARALELKTEMREKMQQRVDRMQERLDSVQ